MIIKNNEVRLIYIESHDPKGPKWEVRLVPGLNEVTNKVWALLMKDSIIAFKVKTGKLAVVNDTDATVDNLPDHDSVAAIAGMNDYDRLMQLSKSRKNHVAQAARDKIRQIDNYSGGNTEEDETDHSPKHELGENHFGASDDALGANVPVKSDK